MPPEYLIVLIKFLLKKLIEGRVLKQPRLNKKAKKAKKAPVKNVGIITGYVDGVKKEYEDLLEFWNNRKGPPIKITKPFRRLSEKGDLILKSIGWGIIKIFRFNPLKTFNNLFLPKVRLFVWGVIFGLLFIGLPLRVYAWYQELPNPGLLIEQGFSKTTRIYDRNGKLLYEIFVDRKYDPVTLDTIPDHVINSTLAVEDDAFYKHKGVRPLSIVRAAKATILDDELQGGSTITQQLIKNVLLSNERTIERKIKEAVLAIVVERMYTKDQILELYMNNVPYGGTAWGIQSAAQKYFGKDVTELDLAESSLLAGLPSAPTAYSPLTDLSVSKQRQKIVLNRMVMLGYITAEEADKAYETELTFVSQVDPIRAPHFIEYVRSELIKEYGTRKVNFGGLEVVTTLDVDLQDEVQEIVREEVAKSNYLRISNGAAIVLDPKSSEILAYVGSTDYFTEGWGAFDVLRAQRQPGSSIKILTYALAFQSGQTAWNVIEDAPVVYKNDWETYKPVNYDGRYHGKVSLRQALANSYNIPAVKLAHQIGPDNIVSLGKEMGLKTWEVDGSYGISITLGGKEVRPLDLANVYATYARGGVYKDYTPFLSIKDLNGNELYKKNKKEKRVVSEEVAFLVTSILSDAASRMPAFGVNNFLSVKGHEVAVKTGTTDQKKDNWTLGYTPSYVVGVWVGNNDNSAMHPTLSSGLSGAAPMWNRIMSVLLEDKVNEGFAIPEGIVVKYDEKCSKREFFIKGTNIPDTLCQKDDDDDDKDDSKDKKKDNKKKR